MRWAYRRLKTSREENLANHVGFVDVYVKQEKNAKNNYEKSGCKPKKQNSCRKNKSYFSL